MEETVRIKLRHIEASEGVRILYACEAGSRAWGFESKNSDYDVRFIYSRPVDWYLTVGRPPRDVLEYPLDSDGLDVSGWDIQKALWLFRKSNPPMLEWLYSPTVYAERGICAPELRRLTADYYSPIAAANHYLHMAHANFKEYLRGPEVWLKKYLYVLRPVLAVKWIERHMNIVPVTFGTLMTGVALDDDVKTAIENLLKAKMAGEELKRGPAIPVLNYFLEAEINRLDGGESVLASLGTPGADSIEPLNALFRKLVRETI